MVRSRGLRFLPRWCTHFLPPVHAHSTVGARSVPRWCTHQFCRQVDKICRQITPYLAENLWHNGGKSLQNTEADTSTTGHPSPKTQETTCKSTWTHAQRSWRQHGRMTPQGSFSPTSRLSRPFLERNWPNAWWPDPKDSTATATLPSRHILQYVTGAEGNSKGSQYNRRVFWPNHRIFRIGAEPVPRRPHLRKGLFYNGSAGPVPIVFYHTSRLQHFVSLWHRHLFNLVLAFSASSASARWYLPCSLS